MPFQRFLSYLIVLSCALVSSGHCDVRLASVFGDHMVLQREPLRSTFLATGGSVVLWQAVLHYFIWITPNEKGAACKRTTRKQLKQSRTT